MFGNRRPDSMAEHITDVDIILESDGELPLWRAHYVRRHLAACWSCRTRKRELDQGVTDFTRLYHKRFDRQIPPADGPRRLFRTRLAAMEMNVAPVPWWRSIFDRRTATYAALAVTLSIAAIMVVQHRPFDWRRSPSMEQRNLMLPNPTLSPGSANSITREDVCRMQGTEDDGLSDNLAREVFQRYSIGRPAPGDYEIDYVVPPALGGSRTADNLWPQPYRGGMWNSRSKDALEERVESLVCSGQLNLRQAQAALATNWIEAYKTYFRSSEPLLDHVAFVKDRAWPFSIQDVSKQ